MTIPPPTRSAEVARPYFARLRELRDRLAIQSGYALSELSMGMTDDFEIAIEEGATIVRIGRAVFGERINEETWIHRRRQHGRGARPRPHRSTRFSNLPISSVSDVAPERRRKLARALKVATTDDNTRSHARVRAQYCSPSSRRPSTP